MRGFCFARISLFQFCTCRVIKAHVKQSVKKPPLVSQNINLLPTQYWGGKAQRGREGEKHRLVASQTSPDLELTTFLVYGTAIPLSHLLGRSLRLLTNSFLPGQFIISIACPKCILQISQYPNNMVAFKNRRRNKVCQNPIKIKFEWSENEPGFYSGGESLKYYTWKCWIDVKV